MLRSRAAGLRGRAAASGARRQRKGQNYEAVLAAMLPDNMIAWYKLDEASGTTIVDYAARVGNLLPNPSFEVAGSPLHLGWGRNLSDGSIEDEAVVIHSGSHAIKLTAGANRATAYYITVLPTLVPGTQYVLRLWTRGDGTNAGRYRVRDDIYGADIVPATTTGVAGTEYQQITAAFIQPVGATKACVWLVCPNVNGGVAYFDDIELLAPVGAGAMNGTLVGTGTTYQQSGIYGPCMQFAGASYISLPWSLVNAMTDGLGLINEGTVLVWNAFTEPDVWGQPDDRAYDKQLWTITAADGPGGYNALYTYKCGGEDFINNPILVSDGDSFQRHSSVISSLGIGWASYGVTWNIAAGRANCYVNGTLDNRETIGTAASAWSAPPFQAQLAAYKGGRLNIAKMKHWVCWDTEFSAEQMALIG